MPQNPNTPLHIAPKPEELTNADLRAVYDYWVEIRGSRNMPQPESMDLLKLASYLHKIYVFEIVDGGADHSLVFNGNFFGGEAASLQRGDTVREIEQGPFRERALTTFKLVVDNKRPVYLGPIKSVYVGREYRVVEVLCLPLSANDRDVTQTLSIFDYVEERPDLAR